MNILLININLGTPVCCGGMETHSDVLISLLAGRGHNVVAGCWTEGTLTTFTDGRPVPARRIRIRNSGDVKAVLGIARICREKKIDVVIANSGREYWPAAIAAKLARTRVVLIRHMSTPLKITTAWMINRMVDRVIAVSSSVRDILTDSGVSPEKIEVIHNCVPLAKFDPQKLVEDRKAAREELLIADSDVVIGAVGSINRGKGVFELLHAADLLLKKHPGLKLKLLFVGPGPERKQLEEEAARLSIKDRLVFTGIRRDVERMYAAMDIFALPSADEAFGLVFAEAMAMGKPVIGADVGGVPELIANGVNGILIPPRDERALCAAIEKYLDDPEFARQAGDAGRKTVERDFSDKAMGDRFDNLFNRLCEGK